MDAEPVMKTKVSLVISRSQEGFRLNSMKHEQNRLLRKSLHRAVVGQCLLSRQTVQRLVFQSGSVEFGPKSAEYTMPVLPPLYSHHKMVNADAL